jgi:hypothetical protein
MKRVLFFTALLLMVCMVTELADAQNRRAGLNSAAFLKIGVGARQVAMGSAVTALYGDVDNMFWNPAGTAMRDNGFLQASFTHNEWFAGLKQNALGATIDLKDIGTIGVGVMTFGVQNIPADRDVTASEKQTSGTYDYLDLVAQVTYSRYITDQLSLGVTAKYISEKIDDQLATGVAFDFGSVYHIGVLDWTVGARLNNLGSDIKFYDFASPIPLTFSIGTALVPISGDNDRLLISVDAVKPQDGIQYYFTGAEYTLMKRVMFRAGYKWNYSSRDDGGWTYAPAIQTTVEGISLGAGFRADFEGYGLRADYSYTKMNLVSDVHRVTIGLGLK